MQIIFTEEDSITHTQTRYLRGGLLRNYHRVHVLRTFNRIPPADLWLHGLHYKSEIPFPDPLRHGMERFNGHLAFFQNDDSLTFAINKIPPTLLDRARLFLRNIWPADVTMIHPSIRDRTGLLNPFLKPLGAKAGDDLGDRPHPISFFGSTTGSPERWRVKALYLLKEAGIPLVGGLFKAPGVAPPPEELCVKSLNRHDYLHTLETTRLSLVLHGHNPLTFRLFESFSRRNLVIAQDLSRICFADCGLMAGKHYVVVKQDLSDLVDRVRYYLGNLDEAQKIADAGFAHFKNHFRFSGVNLPQPLYREIIRTWKGMELLRGSRTPYTIIVRWLLPLIHSL